MIKIHKEVELLQYELSELSKEYQTLIERAKRARDGSYSPYSKFPVGASVLLSNGEIVNGANQENAAYPSGLCAERTALFYCGANYPDQEIKAIAISVQHSPVGFPFPCGSCLQVMSEYQNKQLSNYDVLLIHPDKSEVLMSRGIGNLLPFAFRKEQLGK